MFVTKSFTQADQGRSSHAQTLHMSVDRGIICSKLKVGSSSDQWKDWMEPELHKDVQE